MNSQQRKKRQEKGDLEVPSFGVWAKNDPKIEKQFLSLVS